MKKLVRLINSLEKNEKRYFKRYSGLYSGNKDEREFLVLYDIIDGHKEGQRQSLKEKIAKAKFKNANATAFYLYNIVLTALTDYHRKLSPELELLNFQEQYLILQKKGLHQDMFSLLKQMQKKIEKIDSVIYEFIQLKNEYALILGQNLHSKQSELYNEYNQKIIEKSKIIEAQARINLYNSEITQKVKKGYKFTTDEVEDILEKKWFLNDNLANQHYNVISCVNIIKIILYYNQDPVDWDNFHKTTIEHFQFMIGGNPGKTSIFNKLAAIYNAILSSFITKNISDLENLLSFLQSNKSTVISDENNIEILFNMAKVYVQISTDDSKPPMDFFKTIAAKLETDLEDNSAGNSLMRFYKFRYGCTLMSYCIMKKLYKEAEEISYKLDNFSDKNLNLTDRIKFYLQKLIIVFQNDNESLQLSTVRGYKYIIDKDESLDPILLDIYKFFNQLTVIYDSNEKMSLKDKMKKYIDKIDIRILKKLDVYTLQAWINNGN